MAIHSSFNIYNASAGSGKTYALVRAYLKLLLAPGHRYNYRHILAITFTNKAVAEMKTRIIDTLKVFSNPDILSNTENTMFLELCGALGYNATELHEKSANVLNALVHNYSAFEISTIDGFTHRILRAFAFDLKLPLHFEVELDQEALLNEAVDSLISEAGTDAKLTNVLIDFAMEKADDDKSWDIAQDFSKIAKLLISENDLPFIKALKNKTLNDFEDLKALLVEKIKTCEKALVQTAKTTLNLIEASGVGHSDFNGGFLPKYFEKLAQKNFDVNFGAKWQEDIATKTLYPKRISGTVAMAIESIQPQLSKAFESTKANCFQLKFFKAFYKNTTPISVLNVISRTLEALKEERNIVLISDFNDIISNEIKNQPTPFIYERIGEAFKHYFIDEFQDTSVKQWHNLMPLIANALSSEGGTAMLVGDAKQAIYRWRGGKAEQFMDMFNLREVPFHIKQEVKSLEANYRSNSAIVAFNNGLFDYIGKTVFSNASYAKLYTEAKQKVISAEEGYVNVSFLSIEKEDDKNEVYSHSVLAAIKQSRACKYSYGDITVLVRSKKEGIAVANALNQNSIPVLSSDTLLLTNANEVNFIISVLKVLVQPEDMAIKIEFLTHLAEQLSVEDKHLFFTTYLPMPISKLFLALQHFGIALNAKELLYMPLYDLTETIAQHFGFFAHSNAYLQYFLDLVFEYHLKYGSDITSFIAYFDKKKDSFSIIAPEHQKAVRIMTIHKSKGLEFPIVIFPYADLNIYNDLEPKVWLPIPKAEYLNVPYAYLNFNKDVENFGDNGKQLYNHFKAQQELDSINLLYVALTRAKNQLYIITKKDGNSDTYAGILSGYLTYSGKWQNEQQSYTFGSPTKKINKTTQAIATLKQEYQNFTSRERLNLKIVTTSGTLWDTMQENAMAQGNLLHDIMAKITNQTDLSLVLSNYNYPKKINQDQKNLLVRQIKDIVAHPKLSNYFKTNLVVYNERDIISKQGTLLRPDRLMINELKKTVVIIDYKTGQEDEKHKAQLAGYGHVLKEMGLTVTESLLVYVNDTINVVHV